MHACMHACMHAKSDLKTKCKFMQMMLECTARYTINPFGVAAQLKPKLEAGGFKTFKMMPREVIFCT